MSCNGFRGVAARWPAAGDVKPRTGRCGIDAQSLNDVVNVFKCCIFTWSIFTTMVPAFILGGAIAAFVPAEKVLKYLGADANRFLAYTVASISGVVLAVCSCNIVPLFVSIYRRGAGIGPATTFLYAGPAINVLSMIFVFQVIGFRIGIWRAIGVPVIAVLAGLLMALVWGRKDRIRQAEAALEFAPIDGGPKRLPLVFAFLLALMIYGGIEMPTLPKAIGMVALGLGLLLTVAKSMDRDQVMSWLHETGLLVKLVVPILVPAVLIIGAIAHFTPLLFIDKYLGYRNPFATLYAALFGSLMYFPILTEVAFTKAFLKNHMDVGPAFSVLLTGSGLSLPGMILIGRAMGIWRVVTYVLILLILVLIVSAIFAQSIGAYICPCQN